MADLIEQPSEGENAPEFTVSEISGALKRTIEGAFGRVRVRGEVGRVFRARSGHLYYDLKDDNNVLSCTTWKGQAARLGVVPEEGLEVIATGKLTAFGPQSKYNLNVEDLVVAGEGALMAMLERRKKALAAEGLFAAERKRPLPYLPQVIGVVTSPSGAVIRDILHRLRDRFPRHVLVWPVAVQGKDCAAQVARAIDGFNAIAPGGPVPRPDLLIVARGGGSLEDLWGFNEEIVARAAAASEIPLISAVGHETDTTLIDYVADKRAPTPTAAAELAVPVRLDMLAWVQDQGARLTAGAGRALEQRRQRLQDVARALPRAEDLTAIQRQRFDALSARLDPALRSAATRKRAGLAHAAGRLQPAILIRLIAEKQRSLTDRARALRPEALQRQQMQKTETLGALTARFARAGSRQTERWRSKLDGLERMRATLGYTETLKRGYAVVRSGETVITTRAEAERADRLEIQFKDGRLALADKPAPKPKRATPQQPTPKQGSLFD